MLVHSLTPIVQGDSPITSLENGTVVAEVSAPLNGNEVALNPTTPLENGSAVTKASTSVTAHDTAYRDPSLITSSESGSEVTEPSAPVNGKRKADDDEVEERAEKKTCI